MAGEQREDKIMAKTKTEFLQEIVAAYREAGEIWPATARRIPVAGLRWHNA
jgi:hypothetical protein